MFERWLAGEPVPRLLQEPGGGAGQLLEAAGCKGLEVGGARFSPKHANFIENAGDATTADAWYSGRCCGGMTRGMPSSAFTRRRAAVTAAWMVA